MIGLKFANHGDRNVHAVALTFDDGPNPSATAEILNILDSFNVKASFFVIGKRCMESRTLLERLFENGHLVGNHTFSHSLGDFKACGETIKSIIGAEPKYVRPPYFNLSLCQSEEKYLNTKFIVTGDVDSKDYSDIEPKDVVENVLNYTKNGSIIDFHDGSENDSEMADRSIKTITALPKIINLLLEQKFNFLRLDEMPLIFKDF